MPRGSHNPFPASWTNRTSPATPTTHDERTSVTPFTIGCHLSSSKGYANMAREAASIDANTFQFFTRNPRGGKAKAIDPSDLAAFAEEAKAAGIRSFLAHAPYTLNPASSKPATREFALMTLADDLKRMEATPGQMYNMHPGCHVGQGAERGIELVADALNQVLSPNQTTTLLLETMAGKGTELGGTFEELAAIIERIDLADHVGVCLDTCHVWDAGFDVAGSLDDVLERFDRTIGLERLRAIHLNDSKNPLGARKDRHEAIGDGHLGFDALAAVTNHPKLAHLPFFLETPHDDLAGYGAEIARLREARLRPDEAMGAAATACPSDATAASAATDRTATTDATTTAKELA